MKEHEHIKLVKIGDSFYRKLSTLIAEHVALMPESIEHEVIAYLQDNCSVYGSDYAQELKLIRKIK